MRRLIYLIALVPTLTEWLETGMLPDSFRVAITDASITVLLLIAAWQINRQRDRLEALTLTDPLTGLFNSRCFHADLARELHRAARTSQPIAVAFIDLDHFKRINDKRGHAAGDALLRELAGLLTAHVRKDVDRCYRLGGDEFALILPHADRDGGLQILERLVEQAAGLLAPLGSGMSVGVVAWDGEETADALLGRADALMYEAKQQGRGRILNA